MKPLHDTLLQLQWAQKQSNLLNQKIERFLSKNLQPIVDGYTESGEEEFHLIKAPTIPETWAISLGHIVNALRSSLDYIVWELSRFSTPNIKPSDERGIMFPLFISPNDKAFHRATKFLPSGAIDIVQSLQPYNARDRSKLVLLYFLDALSRTHKHRALPIVARRLLLESATQLMPAYFKGKAVIALPKGPPEYQNPKVGFDVGTEIVLPGPSQYKVGLPISVTDDIHEFIRYEVVPLFTGFFEKPIGI